MSGNTLNVRPYPGLGDLLMLTPALAVIRKEYPNLKIRVSSIYPELLYGNPNVDFMGVDLNDGLLARYNYPGDRKDPDEHHIHATWRSLCEQAKLDTDVPKLRPEIYLPLPRSDKLDLFLVQTQHINQWYGKKVWPWFQQLSERPGFQAIPQCSHVHQLVKLISRAKCVICAEGGISHIAKAVGTPAVVIYGGFAKPQWNGYPDQLNFINPLACGPCWNPDPCINPLHKRCLREISIDMVVEAVNDLIREAA